MLLSFVNFTAFTITALWASASLLRIFSGERRCVHFVIVTYFVFYGVPLLFDELLGIPDYPEMPGFTLAMRDSWTGYFYAVIISVLPSFWWFTSPRPQTSEFESSSDDFPMFVKATLLLLAFSPLLIPILIPHWTSLLNFGSFALNIPARQELGQTATFIAFILVASVQACVLWVLFQRSIKAHHVAVLICSIIINSVLFGKRFIVALAIGSVVVGLWARGTLRGRRMAKTVLLCVVFLGTFSVAYQYGFDRIDPGSLNLYESLRLDFGRDHTLKTAIFAELHPDKLRILEHRGQSLLYYATIWVPRSLWPGKPWPYSVYITSAGLSESPENLWWGFTSGILDESVANFGLLGIFIGSLIVTVVCRIGDNQRTVPAFAQSVIVACLFLTIHLTGQIVFFAIWLLLVIRFSGSRNVQNLIVHSHPYYCLGERKQMYAER